MTWNFTADDAVTIKLWSTKDTRESEKAQFWVPMMYTNDGEGARAPHIQDASKFKGAVRVVTEFDGKAGDRVTIPHVPRITGRGRHGDQLLRGSGQAHTLKTQDVFFDYFATQIISSGPLSDRRVGMKFIDTGRPALRDWFKRKVEEAITLAMFGLTAPANGSVLDCWDDEETAVFLNTIEEFASGQVLFAGDATSDATIDSADVLTAQALTKLETFAKEDQTIPVEEMTGNGENGFLFLTSGRGIEQLMYDEEFREAHTRVIRDERNPLTQRAKWKYGNLYIAEYPKCLKPAANVGRSLLIGAEALLFAKVEDMQYFMDPADDAQLRKALSVRGAAGAKANKIDGTRRNCVAIDHYVRS